MSESQREPLPLLPARPRDGHKGTFGTVCIVGGQAAGSRVMLGGPAFSALAALRSGAGLAVLAVPEPLIVAALAVAPSATGVVLPVDSEGTLQPSRCAEVLDGVLPSVDCLAMGPGLGAGEAQRQIVLRLLAQDRLPLVIDADAINVMAMSEGLQRDLLAPAILTPHPGEFARLARSLSIDADPVSPAARPTAAEALSRRLGCVTVLKGHRTVVSDGLRTWICEAGGPILGTAGTGDVLTGVMVGLVAQMVAGRRDPGRSAIGYGRQIPTAQGGDGRPGAAPGGPSAGPGPACSLFDCARLAVELHARASDRWAARFGDAGMLASDLLEEIPAAMAGLPRREGLA